MSMNIEIKDVKENKESKERKIHLLTIYSFDKVPVEWRKEINAVFTIGTVPPEIQELGNIVFSSENLSTVFITDTSFNGEKSIINLKINDNSIISKVPIFGNDEPELEATVSHALLTAQYEFTKMMNKRNENSDFYVFEPNIIKGGGFASRIKNVILNMIIEKTFSIPMI